ncbi:MAG TPA: PilZ domain-containing protein [Planctomycetota bacterium]|jgi:hypothetical protein|nr:PilZ domain-containing protein [Planctomycetota bacterium]
MFLHDRRSTSRVPAGNLVIHSDVTQEPSEQVLGIAVTLDINEFGVRVQCVDPYVIGDRFRFSVALREEIVSATGRIAHVEKTLNGTFEVGIEFLQISAKDIERIRSYCKEKGSPGKAL